MIVHWMSLKAAGPSRKYDCDHLKQPCHGNSEGTVGRERERERGHIAGLKGVCVRAPTWDSIDSQSMPRGPTLKGFSVTKKGKRRI